MASAVWQRSKACSSKCSIICLGLVVPSFDEFEQRLHAAMRRRKGRRLHRRGVDKAAQLRMQGRIVGAQQRKHMEEPGLRLKRNLALAKRFPEQFQSVAKAGEGRRIVSGQKRDGRFVRCGEVRLAFRQRFDAQPGPIEIGGKNIEAQEQLVKTRSGLARRRVRIMLNDGAGLVGLLPLFDEHADGMLGEHLANSGPQRLQPRLTERKSCQKPNERPARSGPDVAAPTSLTKAGRTRLRHWHRLQA